MMLAALLFFASVFTAVYSSILSPLFKEDGSSVMFPVDAVLDRTMMEMNLNSGHLMNSPDNYKEFIEWIFNQPLFTFEDFDHMIDMKMVPLESAHLAFSKFLNVGKNDPAYPVINACLGSTLKKFLKSFGGFHEDFLEICGKVTEQALDYNYATAIFELVEELQGDFKMIIEDYQISSFFLEEGFRPAEPYLFCYKSMIDAYWCGPVELATILDSFDFAFDPSLMETAKSVFFKPENVRRFIHQICYIESDHNELIRFLVSQPCMTSELISEIIQKSDFDDLDTLELELLMHEKATFECVTHVKFEKFQNNDPLIAQVIPRILELTRPVADKKELFKYLASIPLCPDDHNNWTQSLVRNSFVAFPDFFYPAGDFFPEFIHVYDHLERSDLRKPVFALIYLDVFGHQMNKMNEDDLDYVLDFALASRPLKLFLSEIPIWTEIAETVVKLSFKHGQELLHLAKRGDNTVFGQVFEVTNLISSMATQCMDKSINELREAYSLGDQFIPKISGLGKFEKAFLMLTNPTISRLFFYTFKSLDPDCVFYKSARELYMVYHEKIKETSLTVCKYFTYICNAKRTKTMGDLQQLDHLMWIIKYCFSAPEHAADLDTIREIAEMILGCPQIHFLTLTPDDIEFLRMVLATKPTKTKRILEADGEEEPPTKKPRHF